MGGHARQGSPGLGKEEKEEEEERKEEADNVSNKIYTQGAEEKDLDNVFQKVDKNSESWVDPEQVGADQQHVETHTEPDLTGGRASQIWKFKYRWDNN